MMTHDLAAHIRAMREGRGLTLVQVSGKSGVSRATLSRIEKGETSPTAETLGRLAFAFGISISRLLHPLDPVFQPVIRNEDQPVWKDPGHAFVRRSVSPPNGSLAVELIVCSLGPHQEIKYPSPSVAGQEHHLYVLEGSLSVTVEGLRHDLRAGDCLRYKLMGATSFTTQGAEARYILALS